MRKKRYFISGARFFMTLGLLSLIGSITIALSNRVNPLPWNPSLVIGFGILGFIVFIALGAVLMWFDTSWVTPLLRQQMPFEPDDDTVVRVVTSDDVKKEYFVYGKPEESVHDVIENDWPFKAKLKSKNWFVLDMNGSDVSNRIFLDVEGTLKVVFD
jgi:hypothetical protein